MDLTQKMSDGFDESYFHQDDMVVDTSGKMNCKLEAQSHSGECAHGKDIHISHVAIIGYN